MTDVVLLLGPIVFRDFEVPSRINFGGRQRLAVHQLADGRRIVDSLGRDDAQIAFSGVFSGSDATLRARAVDELRVVGLPLPLTWDVFFYTVLISSFQADYRNSSWIPFQVVCTVVQDEASVIVLEAVPVAAAVLSDVATAATFASSSGFDLQPLRATLAIPGAMTRGTSAYSNAQASLTAVGNSISVFSRTADASLSTVDFASVNSAQAGINSLFTASDATGQLGNLASAAAYIRRASINLANAST